jgi:hypothetical protein
VQRAAQLAGQDGFSGLEARAAVADRPPTFRSFASTPREEGEATIGASWLGEHLTAHLSATAVSSPEDSQRVRLDGSYAGLLLGNWMLIAGAADRWWGPGWEGSLILSSNARPMASVAIERRNSFEFDARMLKWLGPWRASVSMGQLEGSDVAVPDARFFAARVVFRPRSWLEFGLSRTAQWCGEDRPCDLDTFGDLLLGRDNRSASLPVGSEPGNQMAGYDARIRSPWQRIPVALYVQLIGEDEAGGLPGKFLGLGGIEAWGATRWGIGRVYVEVADTACNFSRQRPLFDCAYRNALYPQGYSFRGRTIGHTIGPDGRMLALGTILTDASGSGWTMRVRRIELDRDLISSGLGLTNIELHYSRAFAWGELGVGLEVNDRDAEMPGNSGLGGFVQWRRRS